MLIVFKYHTPSQNMQFCVAFKGVCLSNDMCMCVYPHIGSVFSLLSAADRDRLKRVTVQAREKGTSDSYIPPATLESKQAKSSSVLSPKGNQAKNLSAESNLMSNELG